MAAVASASSAAIGVAPFSSFRSREQRRFFLFPSVGVQTVDFLTPAMGFHSGSVEKRVRPTVLRCQQRRGLVPISCLTSSSSSSSLPSPSSSNIDAAPTTKLYVSGLSFRTTEESLRNAFQNFGELVEVNLVMDRRANRPRGFAFLRYATEEESKKAIEGMHGKFLDGRVIFVEVAKPRSELPPRFNQTPRRY
ncbi:organelle RRM domain-containing protein 6, chloroplastic [Nymphaea colorata]|nr:organelle RRM domain-containing protein 6, chloroplastic [Nymphaea colorata]